MKKFSIIALFLALVLDCAAAEVSPERALAVAERFLGGGTRSGISLTQVKQSGVRSASDPAYYVFNNAGGGFVIISAIEAARPVLGYSNEGKFSFDATMPANLAEWMEDYRTQIEQRRRSGVAATAEEVARWDDILSGRVTAATAAVDLKTPDWGQGEPFNAKCPKDKSGNSTLVGCVAVAISELMAYYKHPEYGVGTLPGYTTDGGIAVPELELGEEYMWGDMLPKYDKVMYTKEQADAVSTLCYHIAVMAQADFGADGTGASTLTTYPRLATYMDYDKGAVHYAKDYVTADKWREMISSSIGQGHPVLMSASSISGSHAFVIDGYDSSGKFLINWGWNGTSNGYYELSAFGSYTLKQTVYIGVRPNAGGSYVSSIEMRGGLNSKGVNFKGIEYITGNIYRDSTFYLRVGRIFNYGDSTFRGSFNLALMNRAGTRKAWMLPTNKSFNITSGYYAFDSLGVSLGKSNSVEEGDYIQAFYKVYGGNTWLPVYYSLNPADSICGKLPVHVQDYSSMEYDSQTSILTVRFFPSEWSACSFLDSSGQSAGSVILYQKKDGILKIRTSGLASGTYRLILYFSGYAKSGTKSYAQKAEIKIVL